MKLAKHPDYNKPMTADQFHAVAGPDYRISGKFPICPRCREVVDLYGVTSPGVQSRFDHRDIEPGSDPYDDCPEARRQLARYLGVSPANYDVIAGNALRAQFFEPENLKIAYQFLHAVLGRGNLPMRTFGDMIKRADRRRVWDYAGIPLWCVPFILLTIAQFRIGENESHFGFKKPRGPADYLWNPAHRCDLLKYFSDTGRKVMGSKSTIEVSEHSYVRVSGAENVWVTDTVAAILYRFKGDN
jgi:hypothetical protein